MHDWLSFGTVLAIAYVVPGPDFVVIAAAAMRNQRLGVLTAFGVVCGLALHSLLAVVGLSAVIRESSWGLPLLRAAGASYLAWTGVSLVRSARNREAPRREAAPDLIPARPVAAWRRGLLTNLLNPKTLLFFVALLPQFVDPSRAVTPQLLALSAITVLAGVAWWSFVVHRAAGLSWWLAQPTRRRRLDYATGAGLLAMALGIVAALWISTGAAGQAPAWPWSHPRGAELEESRP